MLVVWSDDCNRVPDVFSAGLLLECPPLLSTEVVIVLWLWEGVFCIGDRGTVALGTV